MSKSRVRALQSLGVIVVLGASAAGCGCTPTPPPKPIPPTTTKKAPPKMKYWRDADGDGFGTKSTTKWATKKPSGYVTNKSDCDDANPAVNPGKTEVIANGIDDDCNSATPLSKHSSGYPSISGDGSRIAFTSLSDNLVAGDSNNRMDLFVRDTKAKVTRLVKRPSSGAGANGTPEEAVISADGTKVAFVSGASSLASGDMNDRPDVYLHDLLTGTTKIVSVDKTGKQATNSSTQPSISADGSRVAFSSYSDDLVNGDNNGQGDVFVRDVIAGTTTRVSVDHASGQATASSSQPSISANGTKVAFRSEAKLVVGDTNGSLDVFLRDLVNNTTVRVNLDGAGGQAENKSWSEWPSISADGSKVAFLSGAKNLVPGDTNGVYDVFVRDVTADKTIRVSVGAGGKQSNASSSKPSLSGDGLTVAFQSNATNLVDNDTNPFPDVFARHIPTGKTTMKSVSSSGVQADYPSMQPSVSGDGLKVAFHTGAGNLVPGDTNISDDVFVRRGATTELISVAAK